MTRTTPAIPSRPPLYARCDALWVAQARCGAPIQNRWRSMAEVPAQTAKSDAVSAALRERGFKFVGSVISYAFMQAAGLVNDHLVTCFRHRDIQSLTASDSAPGSRRYH